MEKSVAEVENGSGSAGMLSFTVNRLNSLQFRLAEAPKHSLTQVSEEMRTGLFLALKKRESLRQQVKVPFASRLLTHIFVFTDCL